MKTDWIKTFPDIFEDTPFVRSCLDSVERSGFEQGLQRAARVAASYALEDEKADSLCREIAREISSEGWPS